MKKITLLIAFMLFIISMGYGQTVLINPAGDGGFANGTTFAANGWTVSNSANNPWVVGTAPSLGGAMAGNMAYVSNTGGTTHVYDMATPCLNYFYKDVTIPAGQTKITLNLNWYCGGESTYDLWQVFTAPVSVVPASTTTYPGNSLVLVPPGITGAAYVGGGNLQATAVQTATYYLPPALAGTTFRLIFSWKSDDSAGAQPPAALDNISLTSAVPGDYVSIASGNFSSPSTWNLNSVPTPLDLSVTVAAGHTVVIDTATPAAPVTTVNGTLNFGSASTSFTVNGNLTVNSGGAVNALNTTTGKSLSVSGNIVNNGTIDLSVGATTAGSLTLNGSAVQTVSGTGTFTNNIIRNLTFNNTSTAIPNINWQVNNISVDYNLNITNAKINLGTNKLTYGTSAASVGNSFTITNGGFMPGGKFARWYAAGGTGFTSTSQTSLSTSSTGRYPFYTPDGLATRVLFIGRTTPTVGGVYAATYNNVPDFTYGLSILDGTYTVTDRLNSNFVVTTEGTAPVEASTFVTIFAQNAYFPVNSNSRIIKQSAALSGTNVVTGTLSAAQRSGVSQADLTSATGLFIGANSADIALVAIASGNWNSPSTWNKGVVPTCNDSAVIPSGYNVTVNSAGNQVKGITILSGGTLTGASGDLTVGCTLNNNTFVNSGTLTITGGTITLNGNFAMNNGASLNQSGGDFNIDGNANGNVSTSVASGTPIFGIGISGTSYSTGTIALTGGTITIVDPHTATSSSSGYALSVVFPSGFNVEAGAGHTFRFGNGTSVDAGGNVSGFYVDPYVSTGKLNFGTVVINNPSGNNRNVVHPFAVGIHGNLNIIAGAYTPNGLTVRGNINVTGGVYFASSALTLATPSGTTTVINSGAQSVGFVAPGAIKNLATGETANFSSLTINNSNATGVTLTSPLSVSGGLTLTAGKVITTNTNLLTLGTATATGTLTGGSATAYVSGPFARTIASGNTATTFIPFPVGKAAYAPVSIAPVTTTVAVIKAEAFDTNTGTFDASLLNLATTRRWEVPVVSGTVTSLNVRLADANLVALNIPVQAPTATGVYTNTFGSVATFATGTPNTVTASAAIPLASYTGFLSYAKSNLCSGVPAPGNTISSTNNICLGNTVALSIQTSTSGSGVTYQWQSSTDGTNFTDITGATSTTYSVAPTVVTSYRLKVVCAAGPDTGFSTPVQINFASSVTNTASVSRCGPGSVVLTATPSAGANITWFNSLAGNTVLATGTSFTTPAINATTNYYASSSTLQPNAIKAIGAGATTSNTYSNPLYSAWSNIHTQHIITAQELSAAGLAAGPLSSIALDVTSAGTLPMINLSIKIGTTTATDMSAFVGNSGFSTVYTSASYLPVTGINTFTFSTPFNWNGTSNIVLEFCHGNGTSTATMSRTVKSDNTSYVSSIKTNVFAQTDAATICGDTSSNVVTYSSRPQFIFNGTGVCYSPRIVATATINPPPAFTLSAATREICVGATSTAVTIATGGADYNTYTWTPSVGVSGDAVAGWKFNPAVTTTFTLQASSATCNAIPVTVVVNVISLPSTITLADATYCEGSNSVALTPFGGTNTNVILSENFNAATNNWTTANNSVGGTIASASWALKADGFVYISDTFHSNDNSQFYLSNSDLQAGTTTETILTSPAFSTVAYGSATVSFYHHLKEITNGSSHAGIEFSSNGTDWLESNAFEFTTGTAGGFVLGTAVVPPTMMNKATVYVRFKYTGADRYHWAIDNVVIRGEKNPGYTWSPVEGLYTNAAATTPYVAGTPATTVYAKPTVNTTYTITATNPTGCVTTGTATVSLSSTVAPTVPSPTLTICTSGTVANLVATGTGIKWYTAATGGNSLFVTTPLVSGTYYASQTIATCESIVRTPLTVTITTPVAPTVASPTQAICSSGTVASLIATGNGIKWYAAATGGTALDATTALVDGTTYYASQSEGACESTQRTALTVSITINNVPVIDVPSQTFCNSGTVADLTATGTDIKWYTASTGGVVLEASATLASGTYYASQTIDGCESARSPKTVVVNLVVAPTGDNEQEFCTSATLAQLTATGTAVQWYAEATGGTALAADTALVNNTVYYASQTINNCEAASRLAVTVLIYNTIADAPENVTVCNEYILPELENGSYFTQPNGAGTEVAAGTAVNQTKTFYVYAKQGTDIVCSAQNSFTVTVKFVPAPTGDSTQLINGNTADDVTIEDIQIVQIIGSTITWYATEEDALDGVNPIAAGTLLVQGETYYATQTIGTCTSATALAVTVDIVLGKEDFDIKAFTYHPNPVTDILNISYSSEITSVTVFNLLGQQVIAKQPNATEVKIDMSTLADAAYIVNVTAGNTVKTIKVIKKQ